MMHSVADKVLFRPVTLFGQFGSYSLMQAEKVQVSTFAKCWCWFCVGFINFSGFCFDPLRHVLGTFAW
jgi:hypothetical protein